MLVPYTFPQGVGSMQRHKVRSNPVNWDALELQVFNLRFESISPEDRMSKAQRLASTFRKHREPLPEYLQILIQSESAAPRRPLRFRRLSLNVSSR